MAVKAESISSEKRLDIWAQHNELRWRVVLSAPVFSGSIFIGWYTCQVNELYKFGTAVIFMGIFGMFVYWILIKRLGDYAGAYYDSVENKPIVPAPIFGISASSIALFIPFMLGLLMIIMSGMSLPIKESN